MMRPLRVSQESDDEDIGGVERATRALPAGGVLGGGGGGAKAEGGHTAMVADILKEKERAEIRAKAADAEAKGRGDGQVKHVCTPDVYARPRGGERSFLVST